ncbi:methyltransferase domain-containing protein [Streptomyces avicenniae]|uniref:methyltransferase domain-containing protein n=1 Tax=Streptomyces avicenniae TaxID=500153 RepID=UPI000AED6F54
MTSRTGKLHAHEPDLLARLDAAERLPGAEELRAYSYDLLRAAPGARVVDVGCGAGRAVAELDARGLRAAGVDPDAQTLAVARHRWPGADVRVADAYGLPFADASLDGWRADKVFHELREPARALAEARRVLVPGGRAVLLGQDWDTVVIDSDDPALTRALVHARADAVTAPRAARRHRTLLLEAGFLAVTAEVRTVVSTGPATLPMLVQLAALAGAFPRERVDGWLAEQRERAATDRLFVAVPVFLAAGTAPGRPPARGRHRGGQPPSTPTTAASGSSRSVQNSGHASPSAAGRASLYTSAVPGTSPSRAKSAGASRSS